MEISLRFAEFIIKELFERRMKKFLIKIDNPRHIADDVFYSSFF